MNGGASIRGVYIFLCVAAQLIFTCLVFAPLSASAEINAEIPYAGTLRTSNGSLVTGSRNMVFRIYDAPSGGNVLWTGNYTTANGNRVDLTNGDFRVMLGSGNGNALNLDFNDDGYYLGVTIGNDTELSPRERLGATGYAFNAKTVGGYDPSVFLRSASVPLGLTATTSLGVLTIEFAGGYEAQKTASSTNWNAFYTNPSARIENGFGLAWTSNILSCISAGATTSGCLSYTDWNAFNGKLASSSINTSEKLAELIADETGGDGALVFSDAPTFTGTTLFDSLEVEETITVTDTITVGNIETTIDTTNVFAGPIEVSSPDPSSFASDVLFTDGSGVIFGGNGNGIAIYQDSSIGINDLVFAPRGESASAESVRMVAPYDLSLFANAGTDNSGTREPGLVLDQDGSARLYSLSQGDMLDRVFKVDFSNGMEITQGNLNLEYGNVYIAGDDSVTPVLTVDGDAGIRVSNLAADTGTVPLEADTQGNIIPNPSDERLKRNIRTIDDALEIVLDIRGVRYEWRDTARFGSSTEVGFVAQELLEELPEVVHDTGEYLSVNTKNITAVLVEAFKELYEDLREYMNRTEQLEAEVEALKAEVEELREESEADEEEEEEEPAAPEDPPEEEEGEGEPGGEEVMPM